MYEYTELSFAMITVKPELRVRILTSGKRKQFFRLFSDGSIFRIDTSFVTTAQVERLKIT